MFHINDNYNDIKHIYSSRNSIIYTAIHKLTGKSVVMKTISDSIIDEFGFARLQNEYNILSKINSEFIPAAIDYLKINDGYYLVLEYCEGVSLMEYIKEHKLSIKEFLYIAMQIVHAISEIHNAGIIHKDINPANIIYNSATRKVTIIDFGLSTEFLHKKSMNMESCVSEGTLYYISPEQTGRMNHTIDFRTDFYSLGVTFFEMLCGCHPFESDSQTEIIYLHLAKLPRLVKEINKNVPEVLSRLIYKLMEKMPEDRYLNAEGIFFDLNKCLKELSEDGDIAEFELGTGDYSDRFEIPQKLYGRENEISMLMTSYGELLKGGKQLITISGHSGIGKTSLVGELYKPLANSNGMFIYGKFDQYHRNIPYHAILQAIEQFCDFILSENEKDIGSWKTRIEEVLKQDGRLLVNRIPKLALIGGEPKKLPYLSPLEERTRFRAVLQVLIGVIASSDRPLVMFIDDIHLADIGSLEIIEEIMENEEIRALQIVACYRDNEVNEQHPLILSIDKMVTRKVKIQQISLDGLAIGPATQMFAEAFRCSADTVTEFTDVIYNKTNGNPFYMRQFIKLCCTKKNIYFESATKTWKWQIEAIKTCPAEENVVDFLVKNVKQIPYETLQLLSLGACIGPVFKVLTLSEISGKKNAQILLDLKLAVSLEVVYPIQNNIWIDEETEFQFSHDRFQQAFYTILSETERSNIHYTLAVHFERLGFGAVDETEQYFIIADNYSKAFRIIDMENEKRRVSEILLRAAHFASHHSVFDTATRYLEQIIGGFGAVCTDHHFICSVYMEYHSALFSLAKYEAADKIYTMLENHVKEPIHLADSCCLQAISLSNRGRYKDAFMLGVELLEKFGVHFPVEDLMNTIIKEIGLFYHELRNGQFPGIEELPVAVDIQESSIGKVLNRICTAGFFYNPLYSFWAIITSAKRVLENGYTPEGLSLYGSLTLLLLPFRNDYKLSYDLARSAMKLAEKNGYRVFRMYHLFSLINSHWFEDLKNGITYARESYSGNVSVGDFEFACFTYFTTQQIVLETCEHIDGLVAESNSALIFAEKHGNVHAYGSFVTFKQFCKALTSKGSLNGSFDDENFSEAAHIAQISKNNMALSFFYTLRALSAVIYLDFDTAFELTEMAIPLIPSITGFYAVSLHNFVHSLSICKRIDRERCTEEEKASLLVKLSSNQKWLGERAMDAPDNFQHLYDLIEAERYMLENKGTDSFTVYKKMLSMYETAILGAADSNRMYHYALACDLAGIQLIGMDSLRSATVYLKEAHSTYQAWGATAKAQQIIERHNELKRLRFNNLKFREERNANNSTSSMHSGIFSTNSSAVDFDAIIKASQAISSETKLEAILERLISVLLENSGAQNIFYLTKKENHYIIEAEGHSEGEGYSEGEAASILHVKPICIENLPMKILLYVERTQQSVILDDAAASDLYGNDEYILTHLSKSVMCMPVINKGVLKGILYLENNLIEGVFNKQRTEALKTIAAQLAISLENSYLFNNLQQLVDDKTQELREEIAVRKNTEKRLEQMANNDFLTNLPNRRMFQTYLDRSIEIASMSNTNLAVLFIDLDGFKSVNDRYGHDKGDIVLVTTAKRLVASVRSCDTVSRMGGDEFVLILENVKSIEEIEVVCNRIIAVVETPIEFEELGVRAVVTSSIGISLLNVDGLTSEELISNSDKAMYIAKNNGKNQYVFHSKQYKLLDFPIG